MILILLFIFSSCNSDTAKLSEISKVSANFNTGSTSFTGGVTIVGVRTDSNDKVVVSFSDGVMKPIKLDRGDWTFYGIGYDGPSKMAGTMSCGMTSINVRGGSSTSVNLNFSEDGCSGKLARTVKFHTLQVDHCNAFYNYDTNTDSFTPQSDYSPGVTCEGLPNDQKNVPALTYYTLTAMNLSAGKFSDGFTSSCRMYNNVSERIKVPVAVFPYTVRIYRSLQECQANLIPHNEFKMLNGLEANYSSEFDSKLKELSADKSNTRLVVPTAHTKRWKSPFMANIPRFLCNGGLDCFDNLTPVIPDPTPLPAAYTGYVIWNAPKTNQLLISDFAGSNCNDIRYDSKYFGIKDCKIKNRHVYATVVRNELTCKPQTDPNYIYRDLYERDGKIYILYSEGLSGKVDVLNRQGEKLVTFSLPDIFDNIAVKSNGEIFVSSELIGMKSFIPSGSSLVPNFEDSGLLVSEFDITPDGEYIFFADSPSGRMMRTYSVSEGISIHAKSLLQDIRKIQYYPGDNKLYTMVNNSPNTSNVGAIVSQSVEAGATGNPIAVLGAAFLSGFHILNDILYVYGIGDGPGHVISMRKNNSGIWNTVNGLSGNSFLSSTGDRFIAVDNFAYTFEYGSSNLISNKFKLNGEWDKPVDAGNCIETFNLKYQGQNQTVSFRTTEFVTNVFNTYSLYEAAYRMVGTRAPYQDFNRYLFNSMNRDQSKNTASGNISIVQRLLGPQGVGGMLHDFGTCNEIKTLAAVSPVYRNFAVNDPYGGLKTYQVTVTSNSEVMHPFICDDSNASASACLNTYDLILSVRTQGLFELEGYDIKMKCGTSKVGQIDYARTRRAESDKQFHLWNMNDDLAMRLDSNIYYEAGSELRSEISNVVKISTSHIRGRSVVLESSSDWKSSFVTDYERTDTEHGRRVLYVGARPAEFSSLASYAANRSESQYSGNGLFILLINTNLNASSSTVGMAPHPANSALGLPLSMSSLENSMVPGVPFRNIFQVPVSP